MCYPYTHSGYVVKKKCHESVSDMEAKIARLVAGEAVSVNVVSAKVPCLDFIVGVFTVSGCKIGRWRRGIHQSKVGGDFVGEEVLGQRRHKVRSSFEEGGVSRKAAL